MSSDCPACKNGEGNTFDFYEGKFLIKCGECGTVWRASTGEIYYKLSPETRELYRKK